MSPTCRPDIVDMSPTDTNKTGKPKRNIVVLAGEKTQTGQTAPKKDPVLSKLDLKFFPHSDRHKTRYQELISIKGDIIVSTSDKHKKETLFVCRASRVPCDKHKRGHRFQVISIKRDIVVMVIGTVHYHTYQFLHSQLAGCDGNR
jgi:hypothetical protein